MAQRKIISGETFGGIAQSLGISQSELKNINPNIQDIDVIKAGAFINIPGAPTPTSKGSQEIEESLKSIREQVPGITAGVKSLQEIDTIQAPPIDTGAGDVSATGNGVIAGAQGQLDATQKLIEQLTKQSEEAAKRAETAQKGLLASITKREKVAEKQKPIEDITKEALAEFGLTPESVSRVQGLMGQLTTTNQQIVDLEARKQASLDRIEARPGFDLAFMTREQNESSKRYNREISTKASQAGVTAQQIQMERGLWQDARATTNMIVSSATYDQQQQLADLDWTRDTYIDMFDIATKEEQTAWNRSYTLLKDNLDKEQTDLTNKLDLMTTAAQNGINLGWNMTDLQNRTLEDLTTEYSSRVATAEAAITPTPGVTTPGEPEKGFDIETIAYADSVTNNPEFDITNVPADKRGDVQTFLFTNLIQQEARDVNTLGRKLNAVGNLGQNIELTLDELRILILDDKEKQVPFEDVLRSIQVAPITNKGNAELIAREIYGLVPSQEIPEIDERITDEPQATQVNPLEGLQPASLEQILAPVLESLNFPSTFRFTQ